MRTAFATFLLWAGVFALLGLVALLCAIGREAIGERAVLMVQPADMPQGQVLVCLTPLQSCIGDQCPKPTVKA